MGSDLFPPSKRHHQISFSTMPALRILLALALVAVSLTEAAPTIEQLREVYSMPFRARFDGNGVKRGHAFGDIGDSLGGRAKLRFGKRTAPSLEDYFLGNSQPQYSGFSPYYIGHL